MNQDKTEEVQKNKKVGADGLSKKERRALKVAEKESRKPPNASVPNSHINGDCKIGDTINNGKKAKVTCAAIAVEKKAEDVKPELQSKPSKAQLRAERRALQEQQRLAKVDAKTKQESKKTLVKKELGKEPKKKTPPKNAEKKLVGKDENVFLFNHLRYMEQVNSQMCNFEDLHPSFMVLGTKYGTLHICGSNARAMGLISALKELVVDFDTPDSEYFSRALDASIRRHIKYLNSCRQISVSMQNVLNHLQIVMNDLDVNLHDNEQKKILVEALNNFQLSHITKAHQPIITKITQKIQNEDCILIYGWSSIIKKVLISAHANGKKFAVYVVDNRPTLEGKRTLTRLQKDGIPCSFVGISALGSVMNFIDKVLLGAHSLMADGAVKSRIGVAQVALVAKDFDKLIFVCSEAYKFDDLVQSDCFSYNELGDPNSLFDNDDYDSGVEDSDNEEEVGQSYSDGEEKDAEGQNALRDWQQNKYLSPLYLMYDITPPDFISAVVTELGCAPCETAVRRKFAPII